MPILISISVNLSKVTITHSMNHFQNPLTLEKVLDKAQKFCLYRERSEVEMERKMKEWGADQKIIDKVLDDLIDSKFVSNKRFSMAYARGKFNVKGWGRIKIRQGLKFHKISDSLILEVFEQIKLEDYKKTLEKVIVKKMPESLKELDKNEQFELKGKLYRTAAQKGYESALIIEILDELFKE
ncbi:RecX family transcriptional regulator [bacterium]|nr:RecX family transcriptional regulator [bacterium]